MFYHYLLHFELLPPHIHEQSKTAALHLILQTCVDYSGKPRIRQVLIE